MIPEAAAQADLKVRAGHSGEINTLCEGYKARLPAEQNKTLYEIEGEWNYLKNCTGFGAPMSAGN
jgi:hypothetical protein